HARERFRLYCFSNTNRAHELVWSARFAGVMQNLEKIFVSSTIGLRKPDAEAFYFVVKEIGVPACRIIFFDNNLQNVDGARACGLQGVHVMLPSDVPDTLTALGV